MKINLNIRLLLITGIVLCCTHSCWKSNDDPEKSDVINYEVSNEIFPNPERGFMHLLTVSSEGEGLDAEFLHNLRDENITLIHRLYYFEKFKDKALSSAELELMRSDMQKVREAGIKVILCFAYTGQDYIYNTEAGEDAPWSTIEMHLDQLKPIFEENEDVMAFVQAGFIGPWGEWHSSTNGLETTYYKTKVLEKMLSVIPREIMVQVRTPRYKQEIFGTNQPLSQDLAYSGENRARVGHYNDCFMASEDDYGTYTNVEADKQYINQETLFVPAGGETCPPVPDDYPTGCSVARSTMRQLRWTYLNLDWYQPTLNGWRSAGCFDEFQRELGYRLAIISARFQKEAGEDKNLDISIRILNKGYAPLYNYKITSLVLKNINSGISYEFQLPVDIRNCKPLADFSINDTVNLNGISQGIYDLYLKISDRSESLKNRSEYSIRLANTNVWTEENGGMNNLKHQVEINTK
jgi:hypothetical protein